MKSIKLITYIFFSLGIIQLNAQTLYPAQGKKWGKTSVVLDKSDNQISFKDVPSVLYSQMSYTLDMQYKASDQREIVVSFWKNNTWIASKVDKVSKGLGTKPITVTLPSLPLEGNTYAFKSHIRPVGTDWQQALDTDEIKNIKVNFKDLPIIAEGTYYISALTTNQRLLFDITKDHLVVMNDATDVDNQKWILKHSGNNIYTIKNKGSNRYLEIPNGKCENASQVTTHTQANKNHQKWRINLNSNDGSYSIKPVHCITKALDVTEGEFDATTQIWEYHKDNINQKWNIVSVHNTISNTHDIHHKINTEEISLFPNPSIDFVKLKGIKVGDEIIVYDLLGNSIINFTAKQKEEIILTSGLSKGVYIISISERSKLQFIKE